MEQVQRAAATLADRAAATIDAMWDRVEDGALSVAQFRALAASVIAAANTQGVSLADLGVTAEALRQLRDAAPLGLTPEPVQVDQDRLSVALHRIITADIDSAVTADEIAASRRARVTRFARDETLLTVATATQRALKERKAGWVRRTDPNPCTICVNLADGKVRSANVAMARHKGCACLQQPVF